MKRALFVLLAAVLLALSGCTTVENAPSATPSAEPSSTPTPTPAPTPSPTPLPSPVKPSKQIAKYGTFEVEGPAIVVKNMPTEGVKPGFSFLYSDRTYRRETVLSGDVDLVENRLRKAAMGLEGLQKAIEELEGEFREMQIVLDDEAKERTGLDAFRIIYLTEKKGFSLQNVDLYLRGENWDFRFHVATPQILYEDYEELIIFWMNSVDVIEDYRIGGSVLPETPIEEAPAQDQEAFQMMGMITGFAASAICDTDFRAYPKGSQPDSDLVWMVITEYAKLLSLQDVYARVDNGVLLTEEEMNALYMRCFASGKLPKVPSSLRISGVISQNEEGYMISMMNEVEYEAAFRPISYSRNTAGDYMISGDFVSGYAGNELELWRQGRIVLHRNEGEEKPLFSIVSISTSY